MWTEFNSKINVYHFDQKMLSFARSTIFLNRLRIFGCSRCWCQRRYVRGLMCLLAFYGNQSSRRIFLSVYIRLPEDFQKTAENILSPSLLQNFFWGYYSLLDKREFRGVRGHAEDSWCSESPHLVMLCQIILGKVEMHQQRSTVKSISFFCSIGFSLWRERGSSVRTCWSYCLAFLSTFLKSHKLVRSLRVITILETVKSTFTDTSSGARWRSSVNLIIVRLVRIRPFSGVPKLVATISIFLML